MSDNFSHPFPKFKIVFLGELTVGKTSLITRFMYDNFNETYHPTVGIDFLSKTLYLNDRTLTLHLWDTAGQERFRSLIPSYIRNSMVAVIVYDVTKKASFDETFRWVDEVRAERGNDVVILLAGNKTDLDEQRVISTAMGEARAKVLRALFIETSAKLGSNVQLLFKRIASALPDREQMLESDSVNPVNLPPEPNVDADSTKNGCWC